MKELKNIIADNLVHLRKVNKFTQLELAEKLNYSDKAISKWERGESLPDIIMLKSLADMYKVSVDYMLVEHSMLDIKNRKKLGISLNNKLIITLLSSMLIWLCAVLTFVFYSIVLHNSSDWLIWVWAVPLNAVVLIIFSSIWGKKVHILLSISLLIWSLISALYLQFLPYNIWPTFLIGIPCQLATILVGNITVNKATPVAPPINK